MKQRTSAAQEQSTSVAAHVHLVAHRDAVEGLERSAPANGSAHAYEPRVRWMMGGGETSESKLGGGFAALDKRPAAANGISQIWEDKPQKTEDDTDQEDFEEFACKQTLPVFACASKVLSQLLEQSFDIQ